MKQEFKKAIIEEMTKHLYIPALLRRNPEMYKPAREDTDSFFKEIESFAKDMEQAMLIKINKDG